MTLYRPFFNPYPTSCDFACHQKNTAVNNGHDWETPNGTQILASGAATVTIARMGENYGYGNLIKLDHHDGYETVYGHLKSIKVKVNQEVALGQVIGQSDNTGNSTGPHLHFEVIKNGTRVDPMKHIIDKPPPVDGGDPPAEGILGVDLSHWNAGVDLNKAHDLGVRFGYFKLTEGIDYVDDKFIEYWRHAKSLGWQVAPYHYWLTSVPGAAQAQHFIDAMDYFGITDRLDWPAVIDAEDPKAANNSPGNNARNIYDMAKGLQGVGGWPECSIYTRASWWNPYVNTKWEWWRLYLVVAHWGAGGNPAIPQPWKSKGVPHLVHQYGTLKVGAKKIDANKWNTAHYQFPLKPGVPQPPTGDGFEMTLGPVYLDQDLYVPEDVKAVRYVKVEE